MNPTILTYHLDLMTYSSLVNLCQSMNIKLIQIQNDQVNQTMGHLLAINGFESNDEQETINEDYSFMYMSMMTKEEVYQLLDMMKGKNIRVRLKAMQTPSNISYTFKQLYEHIIDEDKQMRERGNK